MKSLIYFGNLFFFGAFIWSIMEVSENPAPLYIGILVISTIGLVIAFIDHCYNYEV
jgi:hypothetical protein